MAFKKTTRQIVVEKRSVFIGSFQEARDIIADFNEMPSNRFNAKYGCKNDNETMTITYAAASYIVSYLSPFLDEKTCEELDVKLCPDSPAEPTWTNSNGETTRLRDLPTTYLRNCERFAQRMSSLSDNGHGCGLVAAIRQELNRRAREAA